MRETYSGPVSIPASKLGSVVRNLTFADATPAAPRPPPAPTDENADPALTTSKKAPARPTPTTTAIRVVLRVRPLSERELADGTASCVSRSKKRPDTVHIRPLNPKRHPVAVRNAGAAIFRFERIFDEASSQAAVFEHTALPMIDGLFRGRSAVVFAYGVTCSGKTWTIQGVDQEPGVLPRSLDVIVNSIAVAKGDGLMQESDISDSVAELTQGRAENGCRRTRRAGKQSKGKVHDSNYIVVDGDVDYKIFASYLEVYNEQCYDLFETSAASCAAEERSEAASAVKAEPAVEQHRNVRAKRILKLKEGSEGEVYAEGITEIEIRSGADIDRLLEFGQQNRFVASTSANEKSSRSHAVFFITLKQTQTVKQAKGPPKILRTTSKLSIVDLAGSERISRTNNSGKRVNEANKINTSLMNLGRCLKVMRHNQRLLVTDPSQKLNVVPFRESRLTRLLQQSLEAGSAVMIANVSPALFDADETIQALRCSAIAREVHIQAPGKKRPVLTDRSNILQNVDITVQDNLQSQKKEVMRSARTKKQPSRESRAATGIVKQKGTDPKDKLITALKKETVLLRMELDDERCARLESERALNDGEQAKEEMYKENDRLFRENEKLKDKLADSEARICLVEAEVREEVVDEAEKIIKHLQESYQRQIDENWEAQKRNDSYTNRLSIVSDTERKENAQRLARRVAMRASRAAFDGIKLSLAEDDGTLEPTGETFNSSDIPEEEDDDEEYIEED